MSKHSELPRPLNNTKINFKWLNVSGRIILWNKGVGSDKVVAKSVFLFDQAPSTHNLSNLQPTIFKFCQFNQKHPVMSAPFKRYILKSSFDHLQTLKIQWWGLIVYEIIWGFRINDVDEEQIIITFRCILTLFLHIFGIARTSRNSDMLRVKFIYVNYCL